MPLLEPGGKAPQGVIQGIVDWNHSLFPTFVVLDGDDPILHVHVRPLQIEDFPSSHSGVKGGDKDGAKLDWDEQYVNPSFESQLRATGRPGRKKKHTVKTHTQSLESFRHGLLQIIRSETVQFLGGDVGKDALVDHVLKKGIVDVVTR